MQRLDIYTRLHIMQRTLKTLEITISAMRDELQSIIDSNQEYVPPKPDSIAENDVHDVILRWDRRGLNVTKIILKEHFFNTPPIQSFEEQFNKLLMNGDIYEVSGVVYPLDSINPRRQKA